MNQSECEANTCNRRQAREKRVPASHDWFSVLLLIGWESGASFANQSLSEVKENQSKCGITFDTQVKTALLRT